MPEPEISVSDEEGGATRHDLMLEGKSVSHLWINHRMMRVGAAPVRMGGIGGVGTEPDHRNKGYSRRVLEHSNRWMEEHGFDCATLFGIRDFYDKFGYAVCLPDGGWEVKARDAERAVSSLTARLFTSEDLPALREIYAANNATQTGSLVREEGFRWFRKGSWYERKAEVSVFTEGDGAVAAYAARDQADEEVVVCEVGARRPEHYADIVRWAAERAVAIRAEKITFLVPPDGLFSAYLTQFGAKQTQEFSRNSGGMGRIIRLASFIEKTLPEWTRRAAAARPLESGLAVRLETDIGGVTLRWSGETIEMSAETWASGVVRLSQRRLMQLAMGYFGADMALVCPDVQASGDLRLFHTLFPRRLAHMWTTDHF